MPKESLKKFDLVAVPDARRSDVAAEVIEQTSASDEPCPRCFGSGMEVIEGKGARRCSCRNTRSGPPAVAKARIPRRYKDCDFRNFFPKHDSQKSAVWMANKLASEFHPDYDGQGLLLTGTCGVGKTHLAVALLKAITDRGFSAMFYEFGALLKEIQGSYNSSTKTSELAVLAPVLEADVLVLDELGASKPTDWVRDTMAHVINTRYNDRKLTIFTSNYLDARVADRDETLEDRIGVRLRSRLFEMCKTVLVEGDDFRRTSVSRR